MTRGNAQVTSKWNSIYLHFYKKEMFFTGDMQ